ncbi:acetylornithine transaminase [Georgenia sp. Z1491]|uniref:acetylornithine transaminase n=1 Tax=Georgenia sp. Z1491 TaxID=3416707 RepID=UPI003CFA3A04
MPADSSDPTSERTSASADSPDSTSEGTFASAGSPGAATDAPAASAEPRTWQDRYTGAVMNTFGVPRLELVSGSGTHVTDSEGRTYLDLLGGIAVLSLGHGHPALVGAVADQVARLGHVSNFFTTEPQVRLAERLLGIAVPGGAPEGSRVFLSNSGTEANEAAVKIVRRHGSARFGPGRPGRILALEHAFHGRTLGALALTHKAAYREPFAPLGPDVTFVAPGDIDAVRRELAVGDVAGLFLEPVQGEAGVTPLPDGFLAAAGQAAREARALVVIDEIQTGIGRTGTWLGHHRPELGGGFVPDVVTLAKGLGGGMPIGATIALGEHAAAQLGPGAHGTTFGGNPVAAAAALAVLDVVGAPGFLQSVDRTGSALRAAVEAVGSPLVTGTRGAGLHIGVQLSGEHSAAISSAAQDAGLIVNPVTPDAIRLAPALVLSDDDVAEAAEKLALALGRVERALATSERGSAPPPVTSERDSAPGGNDADADTDTTGVEEIPR